MNDFEKWFMDQEFYTNMRFIHGDALFVKDGFVYRVLPVQMTYVAWDSSRTKTKDEYVVVTQKWFDRGLNACQEEVNKLKTQLAVYKEDMQLDAEKIVRLNNQLIDQGQRFNNQSQKVRDLEFKCERFQKRIYSALMLIQRNQLYIPALVMEQIGKVLRGGHE